MRIKVNRHEIQFPLDKQPFEARLIVMFLDQPAGRTYEGKLGDPFSSSNRNFECVAAEFWRVRVPFLPLLIWDISYFISLMLHGPCNDELAIRLVHAWGLRARQTIPGKMPHPQYRHLNFDRTDETEQKKKLLREAGVTDEIWRFSIILFVLADEDSSVLGRESLKI